VHPLLPRAHHAADRGSRHERSADSHCAQARRGGRAIVGSFSDAKVLSPVHSTDVYSADVFGRIYESLTETNAFNSDGINQYPYDPQKARQLLEQDGWTRGSDGFYQKDNQKLKFSTVTNSGNRDD
jgi:ABC-type transport system substrate-binding protein